jgi:hypothetical protein
MYMPMATGQDKIILDAISDLIDMIRRQKCKLAGNTILSMKASKLVLDTIGSNSGIHSEDRFQVMTIIHDSQLNGKLRLNFVV